MNLQRIYIQCATPEAIKAVRDMLGTFSDYTNFAPEPNADGSHDAVVYPKALLTRRTLEGTPGVHVFPSLHSPDPLEDGHLKKTAHLPLEGNTAYHLAQAMHAKHDRDEYFNPDV